MLVLRSAAAVPAAAAAVPRPRPRPLPLPPHLPRPLPPPLPASPCPCCAHGSSASRASRSSSPKLMTDGGFLPGAVEGRGGWWEARGQNEEGQKARSINTEISDEQGSNVFPPARSVTLATPPRTPCTRVHMGGGSREGARESVCAASFLLVPPFVAHHHLRPSSNSPLTPHNPYTQHTTQGPSMSMPWLTDGKRLDNEEQSIFNLYYGLARVVAPLLTPPGNSTFDYFAVSKTPTNSSAC